MKKNAFTLVELLGVILLLGLIALITAPVILNSIDESKKNTFTFTADSIVHLVNEYYEKQRSEFGFNYKGDFFDISDDIVRKRLNFPESDITDGNIYINSDGEVIMYVTNGSWCASKEKNNKKVLITKGEDCVTNNILKKEFVDLIEKDYHSFRIQIVSPTNQTINKYEFRINDGEWINNGSSKEFSYTVSKPGIYVVDARVTNSSNEIIETEKINIDIEKIKTPVFTTLPSGVWSKEKEISIKSNDDFKVYYSLDGENYSEFTSNLKFTDKGIISAYATDGVLNSNIVTYNVVKIDNVIPTITSLTKTNGSIIVKANDKDSGINAYCINEDDDSSSCNWTPSNSSTYEYSTKYLNSNVYYVFVKDNAENISVSEKVILFYKNGQIVYFDVSKGVGCTIEEYASSYDSTIGDYTNSLTGYNGLNGEGKQNSCLLFYAFNDDGGETLDLILDHNTTGVTYWTNSSTVDSTGGPKTALNELKNATNSWKGTITPENYILYQEVENGTIYGNYTILYRSEGYKARLITAQEVARITGADVKEGLMFDEITSFYDSMFYFDGLNKNASSTCTTGNTTGCQYGWLYDRTSTNCEALGCLNNADLGMTGYGYWTGTSALGDTDYVWDVDYNGGLDSYRCLNYGDCFGVRPVIEVSKSIIFPGPSPVIPK